MKQKRLARILSLVLVLTFLPTFALADTWYLEDGSITIEATADSEGNTSQRVTQGETSRPDSAPMISNRESSVSTSNTVTIKADTGATADVTLKDTNIDTGGAAVKTEGSGNVDLNIEGTNTVKSGFGYAGVQKNNSGNLELGSDSGSGQLTVSGGEEAAGIGGGIRDSASNITISGGTITANGGRNGAGIGGGQYGSGENITISGGNVTAKGGGFSAGIGGGIASSGSNITISNDAQVKVSGGGGDPFVGAGAAIGNGGDGYSSGPAIHGDEVSPDTSGLYTTGKLEYYGPGADFAQDAPTQTISGTVIPPVAPEPTTSSTSDSSVRADTPAPQPMAAYRVTDPEGNWIAFSETRQDGRLTLTVEADDAVLSGTLYGLSVLENAGITEITLKTAKQEAGFSIREVLVQSAASETFVPGESGTYRLTLDGNAVSFILDGQQQDTLAK